VTVERLSGLDAGFSSFESPTTHLHIVAALVFDAAHARGGMSFRRVRNLLAERIDLVPPFRMRLLEVPFGVDHPRLVEDTHFDLDYHVRRAAVPAPGGRDELARFVADVASRPLDRRRPLWEFHVVEGLERGQVALVTKVHHSIIDGVSGAELVAALFDLSADPSPRPLFGGVRARRRVAPDRLTECDQEDAPGEPGEPGELDGAIDADDRQGSEGSVPSEFARWRQAIGSLPAQIDAVRRAFTGTVQSARHLGPLRREQVAPPPMPFRAPRTSLNRAISPHRRSSFAELPLADIRRVCEMLGGTTNDVVLACAAGALREFFSTRGEHVDAPLVAMVPVSVRTESEQGELGNRISATLVSLATDLDGPAARLEAIRTGMRASKEQCETIGPGFFASWAEAARPAVTNRLSRLLTNLRVFDRMGPPFNVVVSNVPGPDFPLYLAGARLVGIYPFGPIVEGVGVNVTVFSYLDTVHVGVLGCWDLVAEVDVIAKSMSACLDELVSEASRRGRPVPWWHSELPA
jgi:diacylglycerol O-acyltransferase / wax synthase